jgi:hypothetical protein
MGLGFLSSAAALVNELCIFLGARHSIMTSHLVSHEVAMALSSSFALLRPFDSFVAPVWEDCLPNQVIPSIGHAGQHEPKQSLMK